MVEGCVLLKNKENTLPVKPGSCVSLFGKTCKRFIECGAGSAEVITDQHSSFFESMGEIFGRDHVLDGVISEKTDAVIVSVGCMGREGADRDTLELGDEEKNLLDQVFSLAEKAGKRVVLLLNICGPVELGQYAEKADAILCLFIPGMEGGRAVADLVAGRRNPSGKLPLTFPKKYLDCPTLGNFPGYAGEVYYGEGIYVGYRYYDKKEIEPLYPFGFGLSYTDFEFSGLKMDSPVWDSRKQGGLKIRATVKNTGSVPGKEVAQLYLSAVDATLDRPVRELKGFQKVFLNPGEEAEVVFELVPEDLMCYDTGKKEWTLEPGTYTVWVGNSSRELPLTGQFSLEADDPYGFGGGTAVFQILKHPGTAEVFRNYLAGLGVDRGALDDLLKETLQFRPESRMDAVWDTIIAPMLGGLTPQEKKNAGQILLQKLSQVKRR